MIMFLSNMECDNWELGEFFDTHASSLFICASNSVPHIGLINFLHSHPHVVYLVKNSFVYEINQ